MKRLLFTWEMGANFGHVNKISQVAAELQSDFELYIACRNVVALRDLAPDLKAHLLPAPYAPTRPMQKDERAGQCYPGVLMLDGWDTPAKLIPLIEAWRALFVLVKPDVLISQAAPTALLAARGLDFKTALLGAGWDSPPRSHPMACFDATNPETVTIALEQEKTALENANTALNHYDVPPMSQFCDLLDVDETLLAAYPQTDQFGPRDAIEPNHAPYLGQLLSVSTGQRVSWRNRGGARILAYLRPGTSQYQAGVQGLAQIAPNMDVILAAPGIDPHHADQLRQRSVLVCDGPVQLDHLLPDCDLGISHGSSGIGSAFMAFGVPQLCLPTHQEQMMFSKTAANAGCALGIAGQYQGPQVIEAIQKALASKNLTDKATQIQHSIKEDGLDQPALKAADRLRTLAAR